MSPHLSTFCESDLVRHRFTDPAWLAFITLIAPTTDPARARKILRGATGFVYYISITGVTGTAVPRPDAVRRDVERLRGMTTLPLAVGFGISTPDQAAAIAPLADGVVVGSALVRLIGEKGAGRGLIRPRPRTQKRSAGRSTPRLSVKPGSDAIAARQTLAHLAG